MQIHDQKKIEKNSTKHDEMINKFLLEIESNSDIVKLKENDKKNLIKLLSEMLRYEKDSRMRIEELKKRFKNEFLENPGINLRKPKGEKPQKEKISYENIQRIFFSKMANFYNNEERMKGKLNIIK